MSTIFLTGSTGFLGSHFLIGFVGTQFERAYVLIRGETEQIRRDKLVSALQLAAVSYSVKPDIEALLQRVTIVQGDISKPRFGVSDSDLLELQQAHLAQFWHFAASLNFEEHRRDHIKSTNIDGALYAVQFCQAAHIEHFIYISTAYTSGRGNGPVPESLHSPDRSFCNYYEESKCQAEHTVMETCHAIKLPVTIFRPSMVIGNSQTKNPGGSDTALYGFLRELRRLKRAVTGVNEPVRLFCMPQGQVNFIPIDLLMSDIRLVLNTGLVDGDIHHLTSDQCPQIKSALSMICEQLGLTNITLMQRDDSPLSLVETVLEQHLSLYANYINAHKLFARKIAQSHTVTDEEFVAYVTEGIKHLPAEIAPVAARVAAH
ncbi:MAG: SDR family oxidoreductase [Burkholderiales bacterium]|nr:SDR family oxidoreductase [Burkholderiales bacterium]